jgi:hypothetical protein
MRRWTIAAEPHATAMNAVSPPASGRSTRHVAGGGVRVGSHGVSRLEGAHVARRTHGRTRGEACAGTYNVSEGCGRGVRARDASHGASGQRARGERG